MTSPELAGDALHGAWRDVLHDAYGTVVYDSGLRSNAIVGDCRRLLAAFMAGTPNTNGLVGLEVGAGADAWDTSGTPQASPTQSALVDPRPFLVPASDLKIDFLDGDAVASRPTSRIQVRATLGRDVPPWPNGHPTGNLREFGLVARLGGNPVLVNYVTHMVIAKDRSSRLERTIWLQF
jgi:hypothetical protein